MNLNDPRALLAHVNQYSPDLLAGLAALPLELGTDEPVFSLHRLAVHLTDHNRTHSERTPAPGPDAEALAAMDAYLLHRYECARLRRRAAAVAQRAHLDLRDVPDLLTEMATRNFADEGPMPPFVSDLMSAKDAVADTLRVLPDPRPLRYPDVPMRYTRHIDRAVIDYAHQKTAPIARDLAELAPELLAAYQGASAAQAIGPRTRTQLSKLISCLQEASTNATVATNHLRSAARAGQFQLTPS